MTKAPNPGLYHWPAPVTKYDPKYMPEYEAQCDLAIESTEGVEAFLSIIISHGGTKEKAMLAKAVEFRRMLESYEPDIYCPGCRREKDSCWDEPEDCERAMEERGRLDVWHESREPREE